MNAQNIEETSEERDTRSRRDSSDSNRESRTHWGGESSVGCIRFIDLFSGIGGFRLGLERTNKVIRWGRKSKGATRQTNICNQGNSPNSGFSGTEHPKNYRCVWSNDINKYANRIYTKQFGEEGHHSSDIRGVNPEEIPDFDLLCAGFPCQAFSVAGKQKGFQDTRGTLFFEICRIAKAKRPSLLLLENVKGLLNHDRGRTFTVILQSLDELGYWVEWQVLNSKYFGVPQNRERVFIVGHLRDTGGREIFPLRESSQEFNDGSTEEQVALSLQSPGHASGNYRGMNMIGINATNPHNLKEKREYHLSNTSRAIKSSWSNQQPLVLRPPDNWFSQRAVYDPEGQSPTLRGNQNDSAPRILHRIRERAGELRVYDEIVPTISTPSGGGHMPEVIEGIKIRKLTPVECERLQGFPDGWTEGVSDTQRYRALGNAVTVNVIEFLGELILSSFTNMPEKEGSS